MTATISETLKYPFKRFKRIWNFYWILIPIIGYFALMGYIVDILKSVFRGEEEMPKFVGFWKNVGKGFFLFLALIIIQIVYNILIYLFRFIPVLGVILTIVLVIYLILLCPMLIMQYAITEKFKDALDIAKATRTMFIDFWAYVLVILKLFVVMLVWLAASIPIITLIVTVPLMSFSQYYMYGTFYREITGMKGFGKAKVARKPVKKKAKRKRK